MPYYRTLNRTVITAAGLAVNLLCIFPAQAQESRWAAADDPIAKF